MGITKDGNETEKMVLGLVSIARMNTDNSAQGKKKGDLIAHIGPRRYFIEVKKKTMNQSRPYKYIATVAKDPDTDYWVVIPAHISMKMAYKRKGQHAINAFECMSLGLATAKKFTKFRCTPESLESRIKSAIEESQSEENKKWKEFAKEIRKDVEMLAERHQANAAKLLSE